MPDINDIIKEAEQDRERLQRMFNDSSKRLREMEQTQANQSKGLMARFFPPKGSKELAAKIDEAKKNVDDIGKKLSTTKGALSDLDEEKQKPQDYKAELERQQKIKKGVLEKIRDEEAGLARLKNAEKNKSLKDKTLSKLGRGDDSMPEGGDRGFRKDELQSAKDELDSTERKIDALQRKMDYRQNLERRAEQTVKNSQHVKTGDAAHISHLKPDVAPHTSHHVS